jgi:hypothetical protein
MADVLGFLAAARGPHGVDDQRALLVEKSEERQPRRSTNGLQKAIATRCLERFLPGTLLHCAMDSNEILIDDRLDLGGLDETIEFMTPPSPGCVKDDEDGAVTGRRLRLGLVKKGAGGRRGLRVHERNAEDSDGENRPLHAYSILPKCWLVAPCA